MRIVVHPLDHYAHLKDIPEAEGMFAKRGFAARLFLSARSKHPEAEGRV